MIRNRARYALTILVFVGVVAVATLWWTGMHQGENHLCIAAALQGEVCPNASSTEGAVFHLNTLQSLTRNMTQLWQIISLFALALIAIIAEAFGDGHIVRAANRRGWSDTTASPPKEYRHWLSLLEHSPSSSPGHA